MVLLTIDTGTTGQLLNPSEPLTLPSSPYHPLSKGLFVLQRVNGVGRGCPEALKRHGKLGYGQGGGNNKGRQPQGPKANGYA